MQRIAWSNSFIPCKNQKELSMSCVVFLVNKYGCFVENKNMIKEFCGCKPSKKTILILIKILLVLMKNVKALD